MKKSKIYRNLRLPRYKKGPSCPLKAPLQQPASDSSHVAYYPRFGMTYIIHSGHSLGYLLAEAAPIDIAFNIG
jgi:hypothetical protein